MEDGRRKKTWKEKRKKKEKKRADRVHKVRYTTTRYIQ
jgi:hypothetical protein